MFIKNVLTKICIDPLFWILAKSGNYWIYAFLFAKKDRGNIDDAELLAFRKLAIAYSQLQAEPLKKMLKEKSLLEICHEKT